MIKYFIKLISLIGFLTSIGVVANFLRIQHSYETIKTGMSSEETLNIMGEPQEIVGSFEGTSVNWRYYQFPIPHVFILNIKDDIVEQKFNSISP